MSKRIKGNREIQFFAQAARKAKYPVTGGVNGGGWTRLADSVGYPSCNKTEARSVLRGLFGSAPQVWITPAKKNAPKQSCQPLPPENFYLTREWREVRYAALKNSAGKCGCCGRSPEHGVVLHVDHIKPKSKFPELALTLENLQVLCADCNLGKSNKDDTDWRGGR